MDFIRLFTFFYLLLLTWSGPMASEVAEPYQSSENRSIIQLHLPISKNPICPKSLIKMVKEDDADDLYLDSFSQKCRDRIDLIKKNNQIDVSRSNAPNTLIDLYNEKSSSKNIYSRTAMETCTQSKSLDLEEKKKIISKFYYYQERLTAGSNVLSRDRLILHKFLNKKNNLKCPDKRTLDSANKYCEKIRTCPSSISINQLSNQVEQDELLYNKVEYELKLIPNYCDQSPQCRKKLEILLQLKNGLEMKNPWFLENKYFKERHQNKSISRILQQYFNNELNQLQEQQKKIEEFSNSLHKERGSENLKRNRILINSMPEPETRQIIESDDLLYNNLLEVESCIEKGTLDKSIASGILLESTINFLLAIMSTGLIPSYKLALKMGSKISLNLTQSVSKKRLVQLESINLTAESLVWFKDFKDLQDSCFSNKIKYDLKTKNQNDCPSELNELSKSARETGSCLIDAALFFATGLSMIPSISNLKSMQKSYYSSSTIHSRLNNKNIEQIIERRHSLPSSSKKQPNIKIQVENTKPLQSAFITQSPPGINLIESAGTEGQTKYFYEILETLPNGKQVKSTRQFEFDSLTGALNATNPSGRLLLEEMVNGLSGKAHFAFIDVGSLGFVNNNFKGGRNAGDTYLKDVTDKIMQWGKGKVTLARTGGDEFILIVHETDSNKVKTLLENIRNEIRKDYKGPAKQLFSLEKKERVSNLKKAKKSGDKDKIAQAQNEFEEIKNFQQPDISVGSSQIGSQDTLESLMKSTETTQAIKMKGETAVNNGRDGSKYQDFNPPRDLPNPLFRAEIEIPLQSNSWSIPSRRHQSTIPSNTPSMTLTQQEVLIDLGEKKVVRYKDELEREIVFIENKVPDKNGSSSFQIDRQELPLKGNTGLPDGMHPSIQPIMEQIFLSKEHSVILMPKMRVLKYINYFEDGTKSGDEMLKAASEAIRHATRTDDLVFKLNGGDFVLIIDDHTKFPINELQKRINDSFKNNEFVKDILEKEQIIINQKMLQAIKNNNNEELDKLLKRNKNLESLMNEKLEIQFESLKRSEVQKGETIQNLIDRVDNMFPKDP